MQVLHAELPIYGETGDCDGGANACLAQSQAYARGASGGQINAFEIARFRMRAMMPARERASISRTWFLAQQQGRNAYGVQ